MNRSRRRSLALWALGAVLAWEATAWAWHEAVRPRRPPVPDLPVRHQAEPIVAYKVARLAADEEGRLTLFGVGWCLPYAPEDDARCLPAAWGGMAYWGWVPDRKAGTHQAPQTDHGCGFYALGDPDLVPELMAQYPNANCSLQVELSGRVIRHSHGYRAQHQRVLGVRLKRVCGAGVIRLERDESGTLREVAPGCAPATVVSTHPTLDVVVLMCAEHAQHWPMKPLSLADLSGALGVEVTWG